MLATIEQKTTQAKAMLNHAAGKLSQLFSRGDFHKEYHSLNEGQRIIYHAVMMGGNMLITGGGGVGKSHLIRFLSKYVPNLVLTASTGIAGINIDGETIDSLMGFSPDPVQNAKPMSLEVRERLAALRVLLIDEVSMVRVDRLDHIDARLRQAKGSDKPFGGVQILLAGDFCQLPPVVNERSEEGKAFLRAYGEKLFAFEADSFRFGGFTPYVLTEYVRNGNVAQRRILRNLRMGHKIDEAVRFINENALGQTCEQNSIRICKTNAKVKALNDEYYANLAGEERVYRAVVEKDFPMNDLVVDATLRLKKGCRIILCVNNVEAGYRNGDLGVVVRMHQDSIDVKLDRGPTVNVEQHTWKSNHYEPNAQGDLEAVELGNVKQLPVRIGIAITGHKSQGMTLDSAIVDLSGSFNPPGLTYVVISRVTSFARLKLTTPLTKRDIAFSQRATEFTRQVSLEAMARRDTDRVMLPTFK